MRLRHYDDARAFQASVTPFLLRDEAMNSVALGVVDTLVRDPGRYPERYLWAFEDDAERVTAMAWHTPPHPVGLTVMPVDGVALVADAAARLPVPPTQVFGPLDEANRFRDLWCAARGVAVSRTVGHRQFSADRAVLPFPVPGTMRVAVEADRDLVMAWSLAFAADCGLGTTSADTGRSVHSALRDGTRCLWEHDGVPVAMAGAVASTANVVRIGAVYTPPALRGRGYATAATTALTNEQAARRRRCVLYTDAANPTSNSIYQRVGYRPIGESVLYTFA